MASAATHVAAPAIIGWSRGFGRRRKAARVTFREMMVETGIQVSRLSELSSGFPHTPTDDEVTP